MVAKSRTLQFGYMTAPTRYNSVLIPVSNGRNLLSVINDTVKKGNPSETFIDESEAVEALIAQRTRVGRGIFPGPLVRKDGSPEQGGEGNFSQKFIKGNGIISLITQGAQALSGAATVASAANIAGTLAGTLGKATAALAIAKKAGKLAGNLAFGKVGTSISNKLSEKFNKNPEWRPGFPGEAHVVLNTPFGLTRANFCGPGTNIIRRVNRNDQGVNQIDTACKKHDMLYHFAKTPEDIRRADNQMIADVDAVTDAGAVQKALAKGVIQGKKLGERVGILDPSDFADFSKGSGVLDLPNTIADRMEGVQRHMGHILTRTMNLPRQSIRSRFGSNGIQRGGIISGNATMKHAMSGSGVRKTGLLGNVKGRDPTISGMTSSFTSGTGNNALIALSAAHPSEAGNFPRTPGKERRFPLLGRGLLPEETRDSTRRKFLDPTIRNQITSGRILSIGGNSFNLEGSGHLGTVSHTANPRGSGNFSQKFIKGSGIINDITHAAESLKRIGILPSSAGLFPGNVLKKNVLNSLSKVRKSKLKHARIIQARRKKGGHFGVHRYSGSGHNQKGGIFGLLAGLAASIVVPELIKLFTGKKKKRGKGLSLAGAGINGGIAGEGLIGDLGKLLLGASGAFGKAITPALGKIGKEIIPKSILSSIESAVLPGFKRKRRKKGRGLYSNSIHRSSGHYPVSRTSKRKVKTISGRAQNYKPVKISSGLSGKGPKGSSVFMKKLIKQHGLLPMSLSPNALIPLIQAAVKKGKLGNKKQKGGQFGILASLAASLILPKIIKAVGL